MTIHLTRDEKYRIIEQAAKLHLRPRAYIIRLVDADIAQVQQLVSVRSATTDVRTTSSVHAVADSVRAGRSTP